MFSTAAAGAVGRLAAQGRPSVRLGLLVGESDEKNSLAAARGARCAIGKCPSPGSASRRPSVPPRPLQTSAANDSKGWPFTRMSVWR